MKKNIPILIAGVIMAFTTILHLTGGQVDHVVPLLASELDPTDKAVLLGVWHMVSVALMIMAYWLIRQGLKPVVNRNDAMRFIGWLNLLFALVFIAVSVVRWAFAPQWILFLPMGILVLYGLRVGNDRLVEH